MKKEKQFRQKETRDLNKNPITDEERYNGGAIPWGHNSGTITHSPFDSGVHAASTSSLQIQRQKFMKVINGCKGAGSMDILNQIENM